MKRDRDKEAIRIWLDCYNVLNGTDFRVEAYPDEEQRNAKSIDALCRDSQGKTLALEHTRIEAFPGEMTDNARFLDVMGQYEKDPSLAEPGFQTSACIPVGAIPTGICWATLGRDIGVFLKEHVRLGEGTFTFTQGRVSIPIGISKLHVPSLPGSFLVERMWPGKSNECTLKKSLAEKLPKLRDSDADRKVLLLEQRAVAGSVSMDLANYFDKRGRPTWLPDEIWLLKTAALETERYIHVAQLYPVMQGKKADWKDGVVSRYPRL